MQALQCLSMIITWYVYMCTCVPTLKSTQASHDASTKWKVHLLHFFQHALGDALPRTQSALSMLPTPLQAWAESVLPPHRCTLSGSTLCQPPFPAPWLPQPSPPLLLPSLSSTQLRRLLSPQRLQKLWRSCRDITLLSSGWISLRGLWRSTWWPLLLQSSYPRWRSQLLTLWAAGILCCRSEWWMGHDGLREVKGAPDWRWIPAVNTDEKGIRIQVYFVFRSKEHQTRY